MPLAGQAVLISWFNVAAEDRARYYAWHDREHLPALVALPGFQRGRRHLSVDADRDFLVCYEVDDLAALEGPDYRGKANNPTPATVQATKLVRDSVRSLSHVRRSLGAGQGTTVLTLRSGVQQGREAELEHYLAQELLPRLDASPGIVGAHLLVTDESASAYVATSRVGRPTSVPKVIVMIEGSTFDAVNHAVASHLSTESLLKFGAAEPMARGVFQQQISVSKL